MIGIAQQVEVGVGGREAINRYDYEFFSEIESYPTIATSGKKKTG